MKPINYALLTICQDFAPIQRLISLKRSVASIYSKLPPGDGLKPTCGANQPRGATSGGRENGVQAAWPLLAASEPVMNGDLVII